MVIRPELVGSLKHNVRITSYNFSKEKEGRSGTDGATLGAAVGAAVFASRLSGLSRFETLAAVLAVLAVRDVILKGS